MPRFKSYRELVFKKLVTMQNFQLQNNNSTVNVELSFKK